MGNAEAYAIIQGFAADVEAIEADLQRTREVVQALVDALKVERDAWHELHDGNCETLRSDEALSLAKSQLQIEPTKP